MQREDEQVLVCQFVMDLASVGFRSYGQADEVERQRDAA